jgi:hypothetical protein
MREPSTYPTRSKRKLKMEAVYSSESQVNCQTKQRHFPEEVILYSHRYENVNSKQQLFR